MKFKLFATGLVLAMICGGACNTHKKNKSTAVADEPAIQLDTLQILANQPEVKEVYRETNTRLSDLLHTKLEVSFDWTNCRLNGKATLKVKPYFYDTDRLFLDARGMEIKSVDVYDVAKVEEPKKGNKTQVETTEVWHKLTNSEYKYENDSLKISLGKVFSASGYYYVVIDYIAKPNELKSKGGSNAITEDKGLYFINNKGENEFKRTQVWTQGETQASSVWFPTIDSPNERMTQEIYMTVNDKFTTLSNGILVSSTKQPDGMRTDYWKLDEPHAPYLAMMAAGEFFKITDKQWNGREVSYYVEKEYKDHAIDIFGDTPEMIEFYSKVLGVDYAWPKYAQIAVRDFVSGAMENTSATLHGDFMVYQTQREIIDGKRGNAVIAHELFHQWFGDLVTSESWSNLPLNESFATYGEYLWEEYKNGRDAADEHHWQSRQGYMQSQKEVDLIRFNYEDKEDMFDAFSYNKGGQVLHMLRKVVGDQAFFASLKNYLETNKFKAVEIHNLRLAFEETTGRDLNWFFNQWFLSSGRPKLKVESEFKDGQLTLNVKQQQDLKTTPLYRLPLEVDVYTGDTVLRKHIEIREADQTFTFTLAAAPKLVNFDAERQLLCDLDYTKTTEAYIFQYNNAPLFADRLEVLKKTESKLNERPVLDLFKQAATKDKYHGIREFAVAKLEKLAGENLGELKPLLLEVYKNDKKTTTRARALAALNKRFLKDDDVVALNLEALNEPSYAICGEAIMGLTKHDPKLAMERTVNFQKEFGRDVMFPLANLYADHGGDEQIHFFHNALWYVTGFDVLSFCASYAKTARRCTTSTAAIAAARDLESLGKGANKFTKFATLKGLKDIASAWEGKENAAKGKLEQAKREGVATAALEEELRAATETKDILQKMYERSK